ncbi:Glycosyl hydrolases family 43 [Zobellia uliginosa]|uniref:Glycosyl hydrolases family 43 n=1 Tax=Zobellia uliginosa TaxID=143224 RepID=A0ABY1KM23_9FLAO|nr:family 43 glycosylhydrolase [Zobellia uliginosa]SIS48843.1 Glycosyl hydrolases family 43 [Zobellia uliginosa]
MQVNLFLKQSAFSLLMALSLIACSEQKTETKPAPTEDSTTAEHKVFPHKMPTEKPDMPLSAAAERMFSYPAPRVQDNELFSQFKYTRLKGFDYNNGDGTISRRDPSRPILVNGKYYIYYTKRDTKVPPIGWNRAKEATDEIPSTDWDLCDIWYATSEDGTTWKEEGVAIARPEKPKPGWRSVATPDILVWKGKYYLYYQAFNEPSGLRGDWCPVSVSYADSPDGPWTHGKDAVIPFGKKGEWDQDATHDPQPIVYKGKIYLYYKAAYNKWPDIRDKYAVGHGLVIADDPLGPFEKHPLNPVMTSGHETTYFPFKEGVATLAIKDGNERYTMQYAKDGVNFEIASVVSLAPTAAAPFAADAFTDSGNGRGVTWGLSHFTNAGKSSKKAYSIMARFDCDLSLDVDIPSYKKTGVYHDPEVYFAQKPNENRNPEGR